MSERKSEQREDPFEKELVAGIASSRAAMAACFEEAGRFGWTVEIKGLDMIDRMRVRESEISSGIRLLQTMSEVTLAAAKLRGEFRNIHDITRRTENANPVEGEGV